MMQKHTSTTKHKSISQAVRLERFSFMLSMTPMTMTPMTEGAFIPILAAIE